MSPRLNMILRVTAFVGATLLIAFLVYFFLLRGAPRITPPTDGGETPEIPVGNLPGSGPAGERPVPTPEPGEPGGGLPPSPVADGGPTLTVQLTSSPVAAPTLASGNQISFYDPNDGAFYTIDANGNLLRLSDARYPQADDVVFSADTSKVALEFPDGSNIIYDLTTDRQTTLPAHWEGFGFSPDSQGIASKSITVDPNARALVLTNADGSQATSIVSLGNNADDVTVNWSPNNSIVAFSETGSAQAAFGRQEIFLLDTTGDAVGALVVEGSNFSAQWSPSGERILYSVAKTTANDRPSLWIVDGAGTNMGSGRTDLNVETWVEKCTFKDETFVLCAVPREVTNFSGFDHRLITSGDDLYQVNLATGRTFLLAELTSEMQMFNLRVSQDGSILYFTDGSSRLNSMRLR